VNRIADNRAILLYLRQKLSITRRGFFEWVVKAHGGIDVAVDTEIRSQRQHESGQEGPQSISGHFRLSSSDWADARRTIFNDG
jgi:hypothetical protein